MSDVYPKTTRLRFVTAKTPMELVQWTNKIGVRVQIYGAPVWDIGKKRWVLWFVPSDKGSDIAPIDL